MGLRPASHMYEKPRFRGAFHRHDSPDAVHPQKPQHGDILAVALGHSPDDSLTLARPTIQAGPGQIDTRLIDKFHTLRVEPGDTLLVAGMCWLDAPGVLRGDMEWPFLRGSPKRVRGREIVNMLTRRPHCC
jgi:hypothetical protein